MAIEHQTEFLSLPQDIFFKICPFLDNKSLLQLSQTCKLTKENIDCLINTHKMTSEMLIDTIGFYDHEFYFIFGNSFYSLLWASHLTSVLSERDRPVFSSRNSACLRVAVNDKNAKHFFDSVKPLVRQTQFYSIEFVKVRSEIMDMILQLLEGKSIERVECRRDLNGVSQSQFEAELRFIKKMKPNEVECALNFIHKDFIDFMIKAADSTKSFTLYDGIDDECDFQIDMISVIRTMMRAGCRTLHLKNLLPISLDDTEKLIQDMCNSENTSYLLAQFRGESMDVQVGEYAVRSPAASNHVLIEHVNMTNVNS